MCSPQASSTKEHENYFSSQPVKGLIIYAKPGVPYYLCKTLISRRLATGGKASLTATLSSRHIIKKHCALLLSD